MVKIIKATQIYISELALLFDQYRIFYEQESDIIGATNFLNMRFAKNDSVIFLAFDDNKSVGFTQLYSSFSSVSLQPIYILNDLFVNPAYRKKGIGEALLKQAQTYCQKMAFKGLALETGIENPAQELYQRLGWEKDIHCFHYFWSA